MALALALAWAQQPTSWLQACPPSIACLQLVACSPMLGAMAALLRSLGLQLQGALEQAQAQAQRWAQRWALALAALQCPLASCA